jgi:vacuolar-type H+-ATPase subunit C/Vma6
MISPLKIYLCRFILSYGREYINTNAEKYIREVTKMADFFCADPAIRAEFDKLPPAVKESIIESGVQICTAEELKQLAKRIEENM